MQRWTKLMRRRDLLMTQPWQGLTTGAYPTTPSKKQDSWGAQGAAPASHYGDQLGTGDGLWSGVEGGPREVWAGPEKPGNALRSITMNMPIPFTV